MEEIVSSFHKSNSFELIEEEIVRQQMDLEPELLTFMHEKEWPKASPSVLTSSNEIWTPFFGECSRMVQVYCRVVHGSLFLDPTRRNIDPPRDCRQKVWPDPQSDPSPICTFFIWINIYLSFNYYILNIVETQLAYECSFRRFISIQVARNIQ